MNTPAFLPIGAVLLVLFTLSGVALEAGAQSGRPPLYAVLLGGNEVSDDGQAGVGDPDGRGTATVIIRSPDTVCFGIAVTGIGTPNAAHIHEGSAAVNGPIVVTLVPPEDGNPGASSGCISGLDPALLTNIQNRPALYYINVHTEDIPGGALRDQLF